MAHYASFCGACLTSHPRSKISSYEIEISEKAYESAVTVKNIAAGCKTTGIYPFNPHMCLEDKFLMSL